MLRHTLHASAFPLTHDVSFLVLFRVSLRLSFTLSFMPCLNFARFPILALMFWVWGTAQAQTVPPEWPSDPMAQRVMPCTSCHGPEGRATAAGYFPRIAGKPEGYLYQQLLNFRDGHRRHALMAQLLEPLSDDYLRDIARYFSKLSPPYAPPQKPVEAPSVLERGRNLALKGDAALRLPACVRCHGDSLGGVAPFVPGLLGLPRDYLNAQLGAWRAGHRQAQAPDCMKQVAQRLSLSDITAVTAWLSAQQPLVSGVSIKPQARSMTSRPLDCGGLEAAERPKAASPKTVDTDPQVMQGAYLARVGHCAGCHTAQGGADYAGGRGVPTPFGTVYASNLTPDPATGLGAWTPEDFWQAMHHGRSKDGRLLYPAFPYPNFTQVSREDTDALFAYLRMLPPVRQTNKVHALRFPFNLQSALWVWRTLFFTPGTSAPNAAPDSTQSAEWHRGRYLVEGLGHCAACHAPRNALGATVHAQGLEGGRVPESPWIAPALGGGAAPERMALLREGSSGSAGTLSALGPMATVVAGSTQYLTDSDLRAMVQYLSSLPGPSSSKQAVASPAAPEVMQLGQKVYGRHCAQCHGDQGQGRTLRQSEPGSAGATVTVARLVGRTSVMLPQADNVIQVLLKGGYGASTVRRPQPHGMPPFALNLSTEEIAAVATYIRQAWGTPAPAVSVVDVMRTR